MVTMRSVAATTGSAEENWFTLRTIRRVMPLSASAVSTKPRGSTFFGTQWMSMLYGIVFLSHQVGSFLGVWMAGRLFDLTGSYDAMWLLSAGLGLLSAVLN